MMRMWREGIAVVVAGWLAAQAVGAEPAAAWPALPPLPAGPFVVLLAGGIRAGTLVAIDGDRITLDSPSAGMIHLPRSSVVGFRLSRAVPPPDGSLPKAAGIARITFTNGDTVAASAVSGSAGTISFTRAGGRGTPASAPLDRVLAIDFPFTAAPTSHGPWSALDDGSRFAADGVPPPAAADIVATVTPGDQRRWLTSLAAEPSAAAAVRPAWPTARGQTAFTACLIQAPARVRYRLDRPAARFQARLAIDDESGQGGSVVITIRGRAGDDAFRDLFTSAVVRGGDEPLAIDTPLDGVRELEIVVDPADAGPAFDRTIWLDPRITFE